MTQNAKVIKILEQGKALVMVERMSACGENCASCSAGCSFKNTATAIAVNKISAGLGDNVIIRTKTSKILTAAFVVYLMPVFLFITAYVISSALNSSEKVSILVSIAAFFGGAAFAFIYNKAESKKHGIEFEITSLVK